MSYTISVCHPTARLTPNRDLFWHDSMEAFFTRCDHPESVEYILVVHESNWAAYQAWHFVPAWGRFRAICNRGENTMMSQGSCAVAAASGKLLVGSMDDLFPPEHWDSLLLDALGRRLLDQPAVLHVSSGSPSDNTLFIPQILTKARLDQYGYALHPSYESMFSDNEFTEVAKRDGVVIEARHINFEHRHPMLGTAKMDAVYAEENRREAYEQGRVNYETRKTAGFPKDPAWRMPAVPSIALALPGEHFGYDYLAGFARIYGHLLTHNWRVQVCLGHTSNVYATRMVLTESVLSIKPKLDYVLWLDDDNVLDPDQLEILLADLVERPDLAGVVGWCWCDRTETDPEKPFVMSCGRQSAAMAMEPFTREDWESVSAGNPLVPIDWSGFPCVLLRAAVLEQLGARAFLPMVRPELKFGFASEDASFFWAAKQAGLKFAVDMRVKVPHIKMRAIEPQWIPRGKVLEPTERERDALMA